MKIIHWLNKLILKLPAKKQAITQAFTLPSSLDIFTIAFNNKDVIDYQIKLIKGSIKQFC